MNDDIDALIAEVTAQENELALPAFTHDDAWQLGRRLVEMAAERDLAVTIDVRKGTQQVFHAAREGTTPDNDTWVERKVRVVYRFGTSSYLVGLRAKAQGHDFNTQHGLPIQEYAAHGGAFPMRVDGVGIVGVATVSGLAQEDDHALVVEALRELWHPTDTTRHSDVHRGTDLPSDTDVSRGADPTPGTEMVEPYGGGTGIRFKIRNVKIDDQADVVRVRGGGSHKVSFDVLHDCSECGNAINQVIVGLAGEDRAQASVWNGKQRSGSAVKRVNFGTRVEALADDNRGPAEWVNVECDIVVPDEPGAYSVRARYAQAYQGRLMTTEGRAIPQREYQDVLGWWKVDRPDGPGPESTIGTIIVEA